MLYDQSNGLGPGVAIYFTCLSQHPIGIIDLTYEQLNPVPETAPLPLARPQPLENTTPLPQQGIYPHCHLHER